ncbi:restriction endonuclease subunit S [Fibrobacter sp. UWH6]|uniref:restriction endonuclease subunit S n=3 Tax=unclassified Fibrobacter TaxID=2634177 RepID=UPI0009245113|nr:restriction endonuclease subunit S [Fibrobacter sp. UWH6]SHL89434.1 Type I restriction modification DNA specificity domain-containing protein [Fibrobacter sp. UWH6]
MSKIDDLIKKYCPNGVEYKSLGEIGEFYGGLTGKSKDDFVDGNAKFISYMNVYSHLELDIDTPDRVRVEKGEKQHTIGYGDILFTGSSETPSECGFSSVLTKMTDEPLYLNSFSFGLHLYDNGILLPGFSKYVFRSHDVRQQIIKTASGVTRFNVSKEKMKKVVIPVPPLEVQREIVQVLDSFTMLTAELSAELSARKKQYEFYRDQLLSFKKVSPP